MKKFLIFIAIFSALAIGGYYVYSNQMLSDPSDLNQAKEDSLGPSPSRENGESQPLEETAFDLEPAPSPHPEIILASPQHGDQISSPLIVSGQARGTWFFEASFPVILTTDDREVISEGLASTSEPEWMTDEFIPFKAELEFESPENYDRGQLILQKDNPSDLRELDDSIQITVFFE